MKTNLSKLLPVLLIGSALLISSEIRDINRFLDV
jgi:hypothetical protein